MSYRSILLFLDRGPLTHARSQFAIGLARRHEAHLTALAPTGICDLPVSVGGATSMLEYSDIAWQAMRGEAGRTIGSFRELCARESFEAFDASIDESAQAASIVRHAHAADLVVLSQADPTTPNDPVHAAALVEEVVLNSPRPTLLLPYAGHFETAGRNVLVAWDGSRQAGRALVDALPILHRAEHVHLVRWSTTRADADPSARARLESVRQWLGRHRIRATLHLERSLEIGIADAMLSRAADLGADMIVAGAYGHARWTERILGGATRGLLTSMTVPVLMSH